MKKVLALVVAFALCFTVFAGCFVTSAADAAYTVVGSELTADGGAATVTISGNYSVKTAKLLTVTIPAALTFDSVVGMNAYDENSDEDFGYTVATVDGATVLKFLDVYEGDFAIVINVFAPANDKEEVVTYNVTASAEIAAWDATEVSVVEANGNVTVAAKPAAPQGPVLDENIKFTYNINLQATINLTYMIEGIPECDDFYVEFVYDTCNAQYNFNENKTELKVYKSELTPAGTRYAYLFNKLRMYELNIPITATVYCLDANDEVIYVSNPATTTVAAQTKASFTKTTNAKLKTVYSDIIYLAAEAQTYFVNGKDVELADVELPTKDFEGTPSGDLDMNALNKVSDSDPAGAVKGAVNISGNPVVRFQINNAGSYAKEDLKVVVSYTSPKFGEKSQVITSADKTNFASSGTTYFALFTDVAICDGNQNITATVYNGEISEANKICTGVYSVETAIATASTTARVYPLYILVGKLGASARAYWGL